MTYNNEINFHQATKKSRKRNFVVMALYTIIHRAAWQFKNESIVIPSFINTLTGSNLVLGIFPLLSRFCRYPPMILAGRWLEPKPRKKPFFLLVVFAMMLPWAAMAVLLGKWAQLSPSLILPVFIACYVFFWVAQGSTQMASNTLRGKLFPPEMMGRLVGTAGLVGGLLAVPIGLFIKGVLGGEGVGPGTYAIFFAAAAVFFGLNFINVTRLKEPAHPSPVTKMPLGRFLAQVGPTLRSSADFRKLVGISVLTSLFASMLPFYTKFALGEIGVGYGMLGVYFIAQNVTSPLTCFPLGWLADRHGNRMVMRLISFCFPLTPLLAVLISLYGGSSSAWLYVLVYILLAANLNMFLFSTNYLLETTPMKKHPSYIAVMNMVVFCFCLVPLLVGGLLDAFSFRAVFIAVACVFALGPVLCFSMGEPRRGRKVAR